MNKGFTLIELLRMNSVHLPEITLSILILIIASAFQGGILR